MSEGMIKEERGKRNLQRTTTKGSLVAEMAPQADPHYLVVDGNTGRFLYMEVEVDQVISAVST
jgi:hypothetical protein